MSEKPKFRSYVRMAEKDRKKGLRWNVEKRSKPGAAQWMHQDSDIDVGVGAFLHSFKRVLPKGYGSLRTYLTDILAKSSPTQKNVAIEVAGSANRLFSDLRNEGRLHRTFGISVEAPPDSTQDSEGNIILIADATQRKVYNQIETLLQPNEKVCVIIERALGAHSLNQLTIEQTARLFQIWYELLAENGVMLVQVPQNISPQLINNWVERVQAIYPTIEVAYDEGRRSDSHPWEISALRLNKKVGAPSTLPSLL